MRIGAIVLLMNGYCYQSYAWSKFRPLGTLEGVIESLEKYQCDEIAIVRPMRDNDSLIKLEKDLAILKNLNCMTPLSFGGGLRTLNSINMLHSLPVERLIFSSVFLQNKKEFLEYAISLYGRQAIQCLLPLRIRNNKLEVFHSDHNSFLPFDKIKLEAIKEYANEIILYDISNEGNINAFETQIIDMIKIDHEKIIISGGIGSNDIIFAKQRNLASVLIENKVLHEEYSLQRYKNGL